jgi:cold shock CspA family protein
MVMVANALEWLASVQGLAPETREKAQTLFAKHQIDQACLDFFASEAGALLMDAYRRGREEEEVAEVRASPSATEQKANKMGRQKVDRQGEGHYYERHRYVGPVDAPALEARNSVSAMHAAVARSAELRVRPLVESLETSIASTNSNSACKADCSKALDPTASTTTTNSVSGSTCVKTQASSHSKSSEGRRVSDPQEKSSPSSPDGPSSQHPRDGEQVEGVLKSFSEKQGWGFISSQQVLDQDIFVRGAHLPAGTRREEGTPLRCRLFYDKGRPQAREVEWLQREGEQKEEKRLVGQLKTMGETYGFIGCAETFKQYKRDVHVLKAHLPPGWQLYATYSFEVTQNTHGHPQARNILKYTPDANGSVGEVAAARW